MNYLNPPEGTGRPSVGGTQAIARAAALLREIASSGHASCTMAELAARVGLERPTAYRILQRLAVEGLVAQDPASRGYVLGPLLYELGLAAQPSLQLHSLATEATLKLAQDSGDTAYAIIRTGMDSLCIDRQEGDYPVKALMMTSGRRRPMGIGAGSLALLAAMPAAEARQVLQANAVRLRALGAEPSEELALEVERYRAQGFALRAPVEAPEILSLAVAVCNSYGTPMLALSISALKFRIEQRQEQLLTLLRKARHQVEKQLLPRAQP
jgi:DNA-binding IclR family transcriptional regulator